MTKRVVVNDMVAHLWAHQSQNEARSGNGNFSFNGRTLYSYSTDIARIVDGVSGPVALITEHNYSITTGQHKSDARQAVRGVMPCFSVPFIGTMQGADLTQTHASNLRYLLKEYADDIGSIKRKRDLWRPVAEMLQSNVEEIQNYCAAFGLSVPESVSPDNVAATITEIEQHRAKRETPEAVAKRERAAEKRTELARRHYREVSGIYGENWREPWRQSENSIFTAEDKAARAAKLTEINADRLAAWRGGASVHVPYDIDTMLRVRGDTIQTSRGAVFPVEHAKRAFPIIAKLRESKTEYVRNGHTIHLGPFKLDRVDAEGNVTAGCHFVKWPEIELCARQLGLI